ncbi:Sigma-70, region 4, partial [Eubacterium callanderi]
MPDTRDLAYQDYLDGMKYKDIAKKYGVSLSAVKSWAARYWKKESCNPATKKVATKRKDQKIITEEVDQVMGNNGLTDKQRLFCLCY